jgi:hypothetical protein
MSKNRGAYHRRVTEVKTHAANERRDQCRYSESVETEKTWVSLKGKQTVPEPKDQITQLPSPEEVRKDMMIGITRGSIQLGMKFQARIITADAIARGVLKQSD